MKALRFSIVSLVVCLSLMMAGCGPDEPNKDPVKPDDKPSTVSVTGVSLDPTTLTLTEGKSFTLIAKIAPTNADNKGVKWSSSNSSVATVDDNGKVTAVKEGSAIITVTTTDGGFTASCNVTVTAETSSTISVTGVEISDTSLSLEAGQTAILTASVSPYNATDITVSWSSDNTDVVTIDDGGYLIAIKAGSATVTVTTTDGGFAASCKVTVQEAVIHVTGVSVTKESIEMHYRQTDRLGAIVEPSNAQDKSVVWYSTDESVVTIESDGTVRAHSPGTAELIVVTNEGHKTARCQVTINPIHVDYVGVSTSASVIFIGTPLQVEAVVEPRDANDRSVVWSSSDESIATVDQNGLITGISYGRVTIYATSNDGGLTGKYNFWVREETYHVTAISLDRTSLDMSIGMEETLLAEIAPYKATNKAIRWFSSDINIAEVSSIGVVKAKNLGTATITARAEDGWLEAYCTVTVGGTDPSRVTGVRLNMTTMTLVPGGFCALTAIVSPSSATNQLVSWSSSNTSVATVDNAGHVTGIKAGTAVITATTKDGGKTATCTVTVQNEEIPVTGVTLNRTSIVLDVGQSVQLIASVTPSNATNPSIEWGPSSEVASVTQGGLVTALWSGGTTIKAVSHNGCVATCDVAVIRMMKSISISGITTMPAKTTTKLTATTTPSTPDISLLSWSSSDTNIATVNSYGEVNAISTGTVVITAAARDGSGVTATHIITVTPPRTSYIMLSDYDLESGQPLSMVVGEFRNTGCRPYPTGTSATVEWKSSDESIIEISPFTGANPEYQRVLHALKKGTCTITLTASDTGVQRSFDVIVSQ